MSIIDRAYERQMISIERGVWEQITGLESEIIYASKKMHENWQAVCELEGITDPYDLDKHSEIEVTEENREVVEAFNHFAQMFATKVNDHKRLCRLHRLKRTIILNTKEVHTNERSTSNDRDNQGTSADRGRGQSRGSDGRRFSGRRKKRKRR
jgi:hypothetical protein